MASHGEEEEDVLILANKKQRSWVSTEAGAEAEGDAQPAEVAPPFPVVHMVVVTLIVTCDNIAFAQIFPYIGYLILHLGLVTDIKEVGRYAGFIAASYSIAQFVSAPLWGWLSDRVGRRPALILGLAGTLVSTLLFGFASNFVWALSARALWGLLNGNLGVAKCYIAERTHSVHQARAWSWFSCSGSVGRIMGPAIGGWLSTPADSMPRVFSKTGVFGRNPYLLPCVASGVISTVTLFLAVLYLEETLDPKFRTGLCVCRRRAVYKRLHTGVVTPAPSALDTASPAKSESSRDSDTVARQPRVRGHGGSVPLTTPHGRTGSLFVFSKGRAAAAGGSAAVRDGDVDAADVEMELSSESASLVGRERSHSVGPAEEDYDDEKGGDVSAHTREQRSEPPRRSEAAVRISHASESVGKGATAQRRRDDARVSADDGDGDGDTGGSEDVVIAAGARDECWRSPNSASSAGNSSVGGAATSPRGGGAADATPQRKSFAQLLCDKKVMVSSALYGILGLAQAMHMEVLPIWCINKAEDGGVDFSASNIGMVNVTSGLVLAASQLFLYPVLARRLGTLTLYRGMMAVLALLFSSTAFSNYVAHNRVAVWIVLTANFSLALLTSGIAYTCTFQAIRVSTGPENLGAANGIGQSMVALSRAVGPTVASIALAKSLSAHMPFPLDFNFVFLVTGVVTVVPIMLSYCLGSEFNEKAPPPPPRPRSSSSSSTPRCCIMLACCACGSCCCR